MKLAITGLGFTGKTTLYALLAGIKYEAAVLLQLEQKPKVAIVKVLDQRLNLLEEREGPSDKLTFATLELYDTPGLKIPTSRPDENAQPIAILREADGIICVVRPEPPEANATVGQTADLALRQLADVKSEMLVADLSIVEKRIAKLQQQSGRGATQEQDKKELAALAKIQSALESDHDLHSLKLDADISKLIKNYGLLTIKPFIVALNLSEFQLQPETQKVLKNAIVKQYPNYVALPVKLEYELSQPEFSPEERKGFLADYNLSGLTVPQIMPLCYKALGLITFFTIGKDETRGWPIKEGDTALIAAGVIHSDIARGFISAEVIPFQHWLGGGTYKNAKEKGKLRIEGKTYVIHDGDMVHFKFNV